MIERLFARWLSERLTGKPIDDYPKQETSLFWKLTTWIMYSWFFIGLILSYVAYEYGLDSTQCDLCNQLVKQMPSIAIAAAKSDYPQVMRIIWLYLTVTTPLAALAFILMIPLEDFYAITPTSLQKLGLCILFSSVLITGAYYMVYISCGPSIVGTPTRLGKLWIHSIFGGYFFSFTFFAVPAIFIFISIYHLINFLFNR